MKVGYRALLVLSGIFFMQAGYRLFTDQIGQTGFAGALFGIGAVWILIGVLPAPPARWFTERERNRSPHRCSPDLRNLHVAEHQLIEGRSGTMSPATALVQSSAITSQPVAGLFDPRIRRPPAKRLAHAADRHWMVLFEEVGSAPDENPVQ
jgi:hypothetical protein